MAMRESAPPRLRFLSWALLCSGEEAEAFDERQKCRWMTQRRSVSPHALLSASPAPPAVFRLQEQTLVYRPWWFRGFVRESRASRLGSRVSVRAASRNSWWQVALALYSRFAVCSAPCPHSGGLVQCSPTPRASTVDQSPPAANARLPVPGFRDRSALKTSTAPMLSRHSDTRVAAAAGTPDATVPMLARFSDTGVAVAAGTPDATAPMLSRHSDTEVAVSARTADQCLSFSVAQKNDFW